MRYLWLALPLILASCGPSQEEINNTATITCNIMGESRNMDAAMRIREINAAREKIGAEPYLRTDETIKTSFKYGLCEELVKSDTLYDEKLRLMQEMELQLAEIASQEAEAKRQEAEAAKRLAEEAEEAARKKRTEEFLATFTTTDSGLRYKFIVRGNGALPSVTDSVLAHYEGKLLDGTVFDSSYSRGQPVTFGVTQVIPGWTEALQLLPVGSEAEIIVPSDLAYGAGGAGTIIGPNEDLYFKIELLEITN